MKKTEIYKAKFGEGGPFTEFEDGTIFWQHDLPEPTEQDWEQWESEVKNSVQWEKIRAERDILLSNSDFTQLPDAPVNKENWAAYRQELRDITERPDPFNILWPVPPT